MIDRLCLVGVGLIGGSIARAARTNNLCREIIAVDSDSSNLANANNSGVVDHCYADLCEAVSVSDFVVFCIPVGAIFGVLEEAKNFWSSSAVYTDVGSTKVNVVNSLRSVFDGVPDNFIPGHPIAGGEKCGYLAANADLFSGKRVILTPLQNSRQDAVERVTQFWRGIGADVTSMDAQHHDEVLAATSHLPHLIAYALVNMLGLKDEKDEIFKYAAGGFKDFTRIASSDPKMWRDICRANNSPIQRLVVQLKSELDDVSKMLESNDFEQLLEMFQSAKDARQRFLDQYEGVE